MGAHDKKGVIWYYGMGLLWNKVTIIGRLIADLRNNVKATTISSVCSL